jgi:hypothetical protein
MDASIYWKKQYKDYNLQEMSSHSMLSYCKPPFEVSVVIHQSLTHGPLFPLNPQFELYVENYR